MYISLHSEGLKGTDHFYAHIWEENIKMTPKEIEYEALNFILLCQDRFQWQSLPKHSGSIKGG
jgi:hypothetical protein